MFISDSNVISDDSLVVAGALIGLLLNPQYMLQSVASQKA
jgi:hypothetical protein